MLTSYRLLITVTLLSLSLWAAPALRAQTGGSKRKAAELAEQGKRYLREGNPKAASHYLLRAYKRDSENQDYAVLLGQSYFLQGEYKKAIASVKSWTEHRKASAEVFQIYGNSLDALGNTPGAMRAYQTGLTRHPDAGVLHMEMGIMAFAEKNDNEALRHWEEGIRLDPTFSSNYYFAARLLQQEGDLLWAWLYAEIYCNLEPNGKGFSEMSALLFDVYNRARRPGGADWRGEADISRLGSYEFRDVVSRCFTIEDDTLRGEFTLAEADILREYFVNCMDVMDKRYQNPLFTYVKAVQEAGYLSAYTYWLFGDGARGEAGEWYLSYQADYDQFEDWYLNHSFRGQLKKSLYRGMYEKD